MQAGIVINPQSGPRRDPAAARRLARDTLRACGVAGEVEFTRGPGHARALARMMISAGAETVVAWGGDGTVNEVAGEAVSAGVALGVVPGGSGNGFARNLGLDRQAAAALRTAVSGPERVIDTGRVDGRLFVNVAGVGFDAYMAGVFNRLRTRGLAAYARALLREIRTRRGARYTVHTPRETIELTALIIAIANGPEWGAGMTIAPQARLDDGRLDLVCLPARSTAWLLACIPRLLTRTIDRVPAIPHLSVATAEISAAHPLVFHVDGEVCVGGTTLEVRVVPASLRVRVPAVRGR